MATKFNARVQTAAKAAGCWSCDKPFENFILCVPWTDELELLDEMTEGLHGEFARSVAWIDGAVAFARWEGFAVAWGTETFAVVAVSDAAPNELERALRAQLSSTAFASVTRPAVSGQAKTLGASMISGQC